MGGVGKGTGALFHCQSPAVSMSMKLLLSRERNMERVQYCSSHNQTDRDDEVARLELREGKNKGSIGKENSSEEWGLGFWCRMQKRGCMCAVLVSWSMASLC